MGGRSKGGTKAFACCRLPAVPGVWLPAVPGAGELPKTAAPLPQRSTICLSGEGGGCTDWWAGGAAPEPWEPPEPPDTVAVKGSISKDCSIKASC